MTYSFHPAALEEYRQAAEYYAGKQPGLEWRFIEAVEEAVRRINEAPLRHSCVDGEIRRCLTEVFPYAVLYVHEAGHSRILAVMHGHREPGYWKARTG